MRTGFVALLVASLGMVGCSPQAAPPPAVGNNSPAKQQAQPQPVTKAKPAGSNAQASQTDPSSQEKTKLQGTWVASEGEFQGVRMDPGALREMKWVFNGDKVTYTVFGRALQASYTFQPATNPKTFDFKGSETAIQGIYDLKGDVLKVCYAATERPSSFATGGTSQDTMMFVFKRTGR